VLKQQIHSGLSKLACVITVSQWSKREVVAAYDLQPDLVKVIPNGVDLTRFRLLPRDDKAKAQSWLQETLGIEGLYLLYVGPCSPRKNTLGLVQAFGLLKQRQYIPHRLVLAGGPGQYLPTVKAEVARLNLTDDVVFAGLVDDETLVRLYNVASAFVFPSLYEGFGLPVLEAMACGTPVVTSNCTALPETAGDAAALVEDPRDVGSLAGAIQQVLEDSVVRDTLVQRGLARAREFSWQACATAHLKLYRQVAQEHGGKP
jgi:glycosyltransferase involved in cell wall biosynthesis